MESFESSFTQQKVISLGLKLLLLLTFLVIGTRLFELQIIKGNYFLSLSEENRIRKISISAPRGRIFARGGEILAGSIEQKKKIYFTENGIQESQDVKSDSPGEIVSEWVRTYPFTSKTAHVVGYLGEVNEEEIGKTDPKCPEKGAKGLKDLTGRSGLEETYNCKLTGIPGEELIEVDISGKIVRVLGRKEPIPGEDIRSTIDAGLQEKLAGSFTGLKGGGVITDPKGNVLALYSSPSYDPNIFLDKDSIPLVSKALNDKNLPLFDRVIGGVYHPGSTFKPFVAIAALEENKIEKGFTYVDPGVIVVNKFSYSNWYFSQYGRTEGEITLPRALARSTDTFFYKIGEFLGPDKIAQWARKFGLEGLSGIDVPGEVQGLIPDPAWKKSVKKESWYLGNTYHYSIGQGDLAVTPVALNSAYAVLASGGKRCLVNLVQGKENCKIVGINGENLSLVRSGMVDACSEGGTGYTFFDFDPKVACKTGTAEIFLDGKTHAWFSLFAPAEEPQVVTTILVEEGGEGSKVAGPIARELMNYWFKK